jgi:DHA1 family multidrug resistance protein-like MFS transporter
LLGCACVPSPKGQGERSRPQSVKGGLPNQMVKWKRNLVVLSFVQLATMIGFSGYHPFVAYYMQDLGIPSATEAAKWMALFNSGAAISMMIASPIWGMLGDRHGRKIMLVRAISAGCVFTFLMGMATNPTQLVILRIIQGLFSGTVVAAITLVATGTPDEHLGRSLGIMQTAQFVGQSIGPLLGGATADALGYRNVFFVSAALMLGSVLATIVLVREPPRTQIEPEPVVAERKSFRERLAAVANRNTLLLVIALAGNSFAIAVLSPILSLYIKQIIGGEVPNLATIAGTIMSIAAFSSSMSAVVLGRLGDRIGQKRILVGCVIGVALIHIPQAFATHPNQLMVLRAIQGLFMGGIMPTANALLARATSTEHRGAVFGMSHSAQAGGRAVGPMLGAGVSALWGMSSAFLVTSAIFGAIATLVATLVRVPERPANPEPVPASE